MYYITLILGLNLIDCAHYSICQSDEIGKHTRLKIERRKRLVGSSPTSGTEMIRKTSVLIVVITIALISSVLICIGGKEQITNIIQIIVGIFVAWQAFETKESVRLTQIRNQPLLEIEFDGSGVKLINIGESPAYSPSISDLIISSNEVIRFDPLKNSKLPIKKNESREVWINHQRHASRSISSMIDVIPVIKKYLDTKGKSTNLTLECFDKDGEKITRKLYLKLGGHEVNPNGRYLYVSTNK